MRIFLERDLPQLGSQVPSATLHRFWKMLAHHHAQVWNGKVYLADSGLLHALLGIETPSDLGAHPKIGTSWEGFVLKELITRLAARPEECYFWAGIRAVAFSRIEEDVEPAG